MTYTNGYDLPVFGIDNGSFYALHILAVTCIFLSLSSAIFIIAASIKQHGLRTFFTWSKSERFVVYLALCDAFFNICHSLDHLHILLTKDHVRPASLCTFYSVNIVEFVFAQTLMVNVVAINVFVLIFFGKNLDFGKRDWRLLLWTFGTPLLIAMILLSTGQLGPTGAYCFLDGVTGRISNIVLTTGSMCMILTVNSVLYALTWYRIASEAKRLESTLGGTSASVKASHRAARNMFLFLTAFFVQWWALAVNGIWFLFDVPPVALFQIVTTFSNIGGVLNLLVYLVIRRRKRALTPTETSKAATKTTAATAETQAAP
ncbi:adhesion G protein-coupled receptor E1-like [Ylistrum balloti]|uniref:adhesion G protein-coupled receptor E1-like n=1 Tax=Ylistrum balloti TaxID=509963 RepID=UPI002905DBB1|nr:adhesion G protein-coupled receptor E1-like [Ylistrum balloti]